MTLAAQVVGEGSGGEDALATAHEGRLAIRILEAFKHSVEQSGASFVVVHLPRRGDLRVLAATGALPNADLLRHVEARFDFVDTSDALLAESRKTSLGSLFNQSAHYSVVGNRVVSEVLLRRLSEMD